MGTIDSKQREIKKMAKSKHYQKNDTPEKYRYVHQTGCLYEYSEKQQAYVLVYIDNFLVGEKKAIAEYENEDNF